MKFEKEYRERCLARGLDAASIESSLRIVASLVDEAAQAGHELETAPLSLVEAHIAKLVTEGKASEDTIVALARYFLVAGVDAIAIRLLAYLLPIGVLSTMADRIGSLEGDTIKSAVMSGISVPPVGAPPEAYPSATKAFVEALERELGPEKARRVLAFNVHGIPAESFAKERERLHTLGSIDAWLVDFHARQVEVLKKHADDGTLWYEQKITHPVVDFIRQRQEILGGVRDGDTIYVTKIPYDPDRYIRSTDPLEKRRLACHCPLAAGSITEKGAGVPAAWCACSAGYEKFMFDVIFGEETEATVLKSVLAGDDLCRFAVKIPASMLR